MFRKLRLKLMLVNLSVIFMLFVLLITGTYLFVQSRMNEFGEHMMNRISHELVSGKFQNHPPGYEPGGGPDPDGEPVRDHGPGPGPGPLVFFVKITSTGQVLESSPFTPLTKEQTSQLAAQTQQLGGNKGNIPFNKTEYYYRITPDADYQNLFIIFQDSEHDRNILKELVTGLSIAGIICMILSVFGSLFMVDKAMIPIQKAWQQQKNFLADASHEFRTPLAVIQTNLEIVRDNPEETIQSQEHWLSNIYEETLCMTKLVESLLFLARADSHQQLLTKNYFMINQGFHTAAELFRPVAMAKRVNLAIHTENDILFYGDESKLRQIVGILLDNAIRHTPPGGKVTMNLNNSQQGISLSVDDTGEGIEPEHLHGIFERFYQSDSSRSRGGAGLGLSIAKWIIEKHNGTINVVSTLGKGTTFTILLPSTANQSTLNASTLLS